VDVLISEDTYARVRDAIEARAVREITVKGRNAPVMTYEVLGLKGEAVHAEHREPGSKRPSTLEP
jgi:class 3 adenylate cyclase